MKFYLLETFNSSIGLLEKISLRFRSFRKFVFSLTSLKIRSFLEFFFTRIARRSLSVDVDVEKCFLNFVMVYLLLLLQKYHDNS